MILAGQTTAEQQTNALQGMFNFEYKDNVATLDIFNLRIKVTPSIKCELFYLSPYKNGGIPQPKLLLTLEPTDTTRLQDFEDRLAELENESVGD